MHLLFALWDEIFSTTHPLGVRVGLETDFVLLLRQLFHKGSQPLHLCGHVDCDNWSLGALQLGSKCRQPLLPFHHLFFFSREKGE